MSNPQISPVDTFFTSYILFSMIMIFLRKSRNLRNTF